MGHFAYEYSWLLVEIAQITDINICTCFNFVFSNEFIIFILLHLQVNLG